MKLILPTIFAAAVSAFPSDSTNVAGCAKRSPDLVNAIATFCNKRDAGGQFTNDIMVPSDYANDGVTINGWHVQITAGCDPAQWVPADICMTQFHALCASGADTMVGFNGWTGGHDGVCQSWYYHHV